MADNPGESYNPLFIYGGVGLGKTHLLQAIGNQLKQQKPDANIRYLHAERYVSDVVKAYENKAFDDFKRQYHSLDLLLIDDIQFFAKKNRTQEEFFYAFNTLIEEKKQIVITCDTYLKEIVDVDERLRTRFSWGLTVAVEPPELEMRVAILLKKAEESKIHITEDVAFFVAKQIAEVIKNGAYDIVIAGKESLDYNGGMVPGMIAGILGYNFLNSCTDLIIDGSNVKAIREIDGGRETISTTLPIIIGGQKGLVEEKDLRIPNMRGIMTARTKPLTVIEAVDAPINTKAVKFERPAPKSAVKLVAADNLDELINLLHNEAKVI